MTTGCHKVKGIRMSFSLPTFNLTCNIWRFQPPPPGGPPFLSPLCNLAFGRRINRSPELGDLDLALGQMSLLLPPLTDIRDAASVASHAGDLVEVPQASGRYYYVFYVDDIGKGFPNEHRVALLGKAAAVNGGVFVPYIWPAPIP